MRSISMNTRSISLIKSTIKKLVAQYNTRDPIQLTRELDIHVIYNELGNIGGYCFYNNRIRCICVNSSAPKEYIPFIVAHELGHIFLHPDRNIPYLHHYTYANIGKIEREANTFAVELLVPDNEINFTKCVTLTSLSAEYGIPLNFIHLKQF